MNFLYGLITGTFLVAPALIVLAYLLFGRKQENGTSYTNGIPDQHHKQFVEGYHVDSSS